MANTRTYQLNVNGNATASMSALRQEARQLDQLLRTLPAGSAQAQAALQQLADVRDDMGDLRAQMAALAPDAKIKGFLALGEAATSAFTVATVAAKEFGLSGGAIEQYQAKVVGLIGVIESLETFRSALEPQRYAGIKAIWTSITGGLASVRAGFNLTAIQARVASITMRQALLATGVGALVVAIGLLVANFEKVKEVGGRIYATYKNTFDGITGFVEKNSAAIRGFFAITTLGISELAVFGYKKYKEFTAKTAAEEAAAAVKLAAARNARMVGDEKKYADHIDKQLGIDKRAAEARAKINSASEVEQAQVALQSAKDRVEALRGVRAADDELRARLLEARAAVADAERNLTKAQEAEAKKRKDAADEAAKKAKDAAEKAAKERLEVERNTTKLLIANITDETLRKLEELDEQAKQERESVKGSAEQRALQIRLIDEKLAADRAKVQADADKARLDKEKETAQKEIDILHQKELALAEVEVQAAQRSISTDGVGRLFKARLAQLEVQKQAELAQKDLTEEAKLAIVAKYQTLTTQLEQESADGRYELITQSIQRAAQSVAGIIQQLTQDAAAQLDAQLQSLQDRTSAIDAQLNETRSRIQTDEKALEGATGQRRAALIAKIEQEKKAEAALAAEKRQAAAEQLRVEKERQKLQDRANQANQVAVAIETILATVEMIRTAAKSGEFAGPAAPFVIAATAAAGVAAAISLKNALKFREGGLLDGPSHEQGGIRGRGAFGNVEVEGGEFIVNRKATAQFLPLLHQINDVGRTRYIPASSVRFAGGGVLPAPTVTSQSGTSSQEVIGELQAIRAQLVQVQQAVMIAPTLLPQPKVSIGELEAEAISTLQEKARTNRELATF